MSSDIDQARRIVDDATVELCGVDGVDHLLRDLQIASAALGRVARALSLGEASSLGLRPVVRQCCHRCGNTLTPVIVGGLVAGYVPCPCPREVVL